nr:hypothetical protein StreXyl84_16660 [Streptomyces sp. Xyl84]
MARGAGLGACGVGRGAGLNEADRRWSGEEDPVRDRPVAPAEPSRDRGGVQEWRGLVTVT